MKQTYPKLRRNTFKSYYSAEYIDEWAQNFESLMSTGTYFDVLTSQPIIDYYTNLEARKCIINICHNLEYFEIVYPCPGAYYDWHWMPDIFEWYPWCKCWTNNLYIFKRRIWERNFEIIASSFKNTNLSEIINFRTKEIRECQINDAALLMCKIEASDGAKWYLIQKELSKNIPIQRSELMHYKQEILRRAQKLKNSETAPS